MSDRVSKMSDCVQRHLREQGLGSVAPKEAEEVLAEAGLLSISNPPGRDLRFLLRELERKEQLDRFCGAHREPTSRGDPWWWVISRV